ncbi:hypothetical protein GA0074695_1908 [Micromonospora viridifaciens]|uniref:Uncharacterized protein n=1 Tax=Micromonospora viridifaciens TaxID=1881 RepID=A0A1C4VXQ2_MICVI|nr:hypothetical protein [Micromonospora viridifaciens]SCE88784.1 hypothetical protein GA0074695_1908 [Micromonospora viridifaciens]
MVRGASARLPHRNTEVLVDVTSIISAEDFVVAQNRCSRPGDPFARQAFVELIQSLIFMERVWVAHPVLARPSAGDFGDKPYLLRALVDAGLLHPLRLDADESSLAREAEEAALHDLQSWRGNRVLGQFIEQAITCDDALRGTRNSLSKRIRGWCAFQAANVRVVGHHADRIGTSDGVEDDPFGAWARAASIVLRGPLQSMAPPGEEVYVAATLARGLKYRSRADVTGLSYQAHPIRRDFLLTFDLSREGAAEGVVLDVIKAIRGIHQSLVTAADDSDTHRVQLLELELPLLGGRLWQAAETGKMGEHEWIELVVARIAEYRQKATDLRAAVARCVTDEDYLRLARDIDGAKQQLLERLGLRKVALSSVEQELVNGVASVAEAVPGVPKVTGMWIGARTLGKQISATGTPVQRFLYKEFYRAWKRAGR